MPSSTTIGIHDTDRIIVVNHDESLSIYLFNFEQVATHEIVLYGHRKQWAIEQIEASDYGEVINHLFSVQPEKKEEEAKFEPREDTEERKHAWPAERLFHDGQELIAGLCPHCGKNGGTYEMYNDLWHVKCWETVNEELNEVIYSK